jgi:hypothetical protein
MSDPDPIGAASRGERRRRRLKGEDSCALCAENRLPALLEVDHYIGQQIEPDATWTLCKNDHSVETAKRKALGLSMEPAAPGFDWVIAVVGGLGRMLTSIGEHLLKAAQWLIGAQEGLDADFPGWRDRPWALRP